MRIALVTPYDYPYPGGVTEHIRHLDREFRLRGHETRIIAPSSQEQSAAEANVIQVSRDVLSIPFNGSTARIALSPRIQQRVEEILSDEQFDVIHVHEPEAPLVNWSVLNASRAVNVGTFHAFTENKRLYRNVQPFIEWVWLELDGRIFVSPALRDAWQPYIFGETRLIPNGIDTRRFADPDVLPIAEFDDGRPNILFVGRLEPRKGFPHLLKAYPEIKRAHPTARLLVVGAFTQEEIAPLAQEGLKDVHWIGRVSNQDLARYYRTATVFCAPSTGGESFGIVLLEGMAAGLPVVASGIAGYRSVMQDGVQGRLVPPGDESALAEALIGLLRDPVRRTQMAAHGRETAAQYDWSVVAPRVLDYYQELLERRPSWRKAPAGTPPSQEQRLMVPQGVSVVVDVRGHLKLEGWDEPEIFACAQGDGEVHVDLQETAVSVTGLTPGKEYIVYVPRDANVHITYVGGQAQVRRLDNRLEIERVASHLKLEQIASVQVRSVSGHLSAYEIQAGLECGLIGGHLTVHQMQGRLAAETVGHASIDELVGAITLRVGGKAQVSFLPPTDPVFQEASSIQAAGKITLALASSANATLTITDSRGSQTVLFGNGGVPISLNSPDRVVVNKAWLSGAKISLAEKAQSVLFRKLLD